MSRALPTFLMEIALRSEIPTYSGGLGVLAGDTVRSAADLALPLVILDVLATRLLHRRPAVVGRNAPPSPGWVLSPNAHAVHRVYRHP
jgi:starch phosphorylase